MGGDLPQFDSGFNRMIGVELLSAEPGEARARIAVAEHHKQPYGFVHGGVYSTLVEGLCSAITMRSVLEDGMVATGQSQATSFLRPITQGHVNVSAKARHQGRSSWIWDAEVTDDDGRLCALSRMTIAVRPRTD